MKIRSSAMALLLLQLAAADRRILQQPGGATPENNFNPATLSVNSGDIIATPITPNAPYPQNSLQCNVSGDSRIPGYSTYPLTVVVPKGKMVRVIFANGNLGGATVTQQGEPGVIVQQGGIVVQQSGSASPIVQSVGSPVVQQQAPAGALVVQQGPTTVVQQPTYPQATVVQQSQPAQPASPGRPTAPTPPASPAPVIPSGSCGGGVAVAGVSVSLPCNGLPGVSVNLPGLSLPGIGISIGRKLLQDTVPGGPNNGQVEYVALSSANNVPGFVVPNTQFGVPYVEFTSSDAAVEQTATFQGALEVAVVVGGVPQYPFRPNPNLSPGCQVVVSFKVA